MQMQRRRDLFCKMKICFMQVRTTKKPGKCVHRWMLQRVMDKSAVCVHFPVALFWVIECLKSALSEKMDNSMYLATKDTHKDTASTLLPTACWKEGCWIQMWHKNPEENDPCAKRSQRPLIRPITWEQWTHKTTLPQSWASSKNASMQLFRTNSNCLGLMRSRFNTTRQQTTDHFWGR